MQLSFSGHSARDGFSQDIMRPKIQWNADGHRQSFPWGTRPFYTWGLDQFWHKSIIQRLNIAKPVLLMLSLFGPKKTLKLAASHSDSPKLLSSTCSVVKQIESKRRCGHCARRKPAQAPPGHGLAMGLSVNHGERTMVNRGKPW